MSVVNATLLFIVPLLAGFLYVIGFPSTYLPRFLPSSVIGISIFLFMLQLTPRTGKNIKTSSLKRDLTITVSFLLGIYFAAYYWIPDTIRIFGNIPFPYNHLMGIGTSLIIVPQFWILLLLKRILCRVNINETIFTNSVSKRNMLIAVVITLLECFTPQQFPGHYGHSWLNLAPYISPATYFGAPFFSFMGYWLSLSLVSMLEDRKIDFAGIALFIITMVVGLIAPIEYSPEDHPAHHENRLRLVQANIGNHLKISSERGGYRATQDVFNRYLNMSTKEGNEPVDLIIWPETAFPGVQKSYELYSNPRRIPGLLREIVRRTNAQLFFGGYDYSIQKETSYFENQFNAAFLLSPSGEDGSAVLDDVYHKMKLIPFGETLPFGPLNKYISQYVRNISYFASGKKYTLFKTKKGTPFITAICYEILFYDFVRRYLNANESRPQFIINLTNDSWYGDTSEPLQHLFLAKWRAVEFQMPIVRMTNTGITSILYPDGSESKRLGVYKQEVMDITLKTYPRETTIFQDFGLWADAILWIFIFAIIQIFSILWNLFFRKKGATIVI